MSKVVHWLTNREQHLFYWINRRFRHSFLDSLFSTATHLGGAALTISIVLSVSLLGHGEWRTAGIQGCIALVSSHIPVAVMKRTYPRLRPYLVFPDTNTCKNPLKDHSFPSGHTTAIFSIVVPFICLNPSLGFVLLPLAFIVGLSRIYLGLHYPSDCLAGSFIGSASSLASVAFFQ